MANDIDLFALNAAISINSLIDFTPSGSKRTASIQLDVIQAIRTALLARGIDPNEPLPPAESVAHGGESGIEYSPHGNWKIDRNTNTVYCAQDGGWCAWGTVAEYENPEKPTPTPATGSGGDREVNPNGEVTL